MREIRIECASTIPIGRQGENEAVEVRFPVVDEWQTLYGAGTFQLIHQRKGDEEPYAVSLRTEGNDVIWTVSNTDTAYDGNGRCELSYYVGDTLAKSKIYSTIVYPSMSDVGEDPPEPWESWVDEVLQAGSQAQESAADASASATTAANAATQANAAKTEAQLAQTAAEAAKTVAETAQTVSEAAAASAVAAKNAAETAVDHYPRVSTTTGNWEVWSTIGGAWHDTGVQAQGEDGQPGAPGADGQDGAPGADGHSPVVTATKSGTVTTIEVDDAAIATINDGAKGDTGATGATGAKGDKGDTGEKGEKGDKGDTGATGAQGAQGVPGAPGQDGADGVSPAVTITQTATGHTVKITDRDHPQGQSFNVSNGAPGENGAPGAKGDKGDKGDKGEDGADGEDGKPGWYYTKENLPDADPSFGFDIGGFTPTVPAPSAGNYLFWSRTSSVYKIQSISGRYAFVEENPLSLRGAQGIQGIQGVPGTPGAAGYSPVRGTDYWTAADIAAIKGYVDDAILGGAW